MHTSEMFQLDKKGYYSSNIGAVLGQIATGGGGSHLEEQLMSLDVPSLSTHSFVHLKKSFGTALESLVTKELLSADKEELEYAVTNNIKFEDIPACTVVDGGWNKQNHKHSYNVNTGVGVIFGLHTKKLLFIGVRNKYYSICSIVQYRKTSVPSRKCYQVILLHN